MIAPSAFTTDQEYAACRIDVDHWRPCIAEALDRHGYDGGVPASSAGYNATYPIFIIGDVILSLLRSGISLIHGKLACSRSTFVIAG